MKFAESEILSIESVDQKGWKTTLINFIVIIVIVVSSVFFYQNAFYSYVNVPLANSLYQDII